MPLTDRENYLRTIRRQGPEWIPTTIGFSPAIWRELRGELDRLIARHPVLFPGHVPGQRNYDDPVHRHHVGETFVDAWGCPRETATEGITGQIVGNPLADWNALDTLVPPDPAVVDDLGPIDWNERRAACQRARQAGRLVSGSLPHGHFYLRLGYLRGWENFLMDVALGDPRLDRLIALVERFNVGLVQRWLDIGVEIVKFADDLGAQFDTLLSPAQFRRYITPSFGRLAQMCKQAGAHTWLHTDGHIMNVIDQLLDWPIDVINCQDLVNNVEELARAVDGRATIDLDIDRQKVVPFGTPAEIAAMIEHEVRTLGSPAGGLMLTVGFYPPTPPENIDAVLTALEKHRAL